MSGEQREKVHQGGAINALRFWPHNSADWIVFLGLVGGWMQYSVIHIWSMIVMFVVLELRNAQFLALIWLK